jgi:hypothetical protein
MNIIDLDAWTENVISLWKDKEIKLERGASLTAIDQVEKIIGFQFSESFKNLYLKVNGFRNLDSDDNMFSIWPIEKIKEEYLLDTNKNFIGFCDYMIFSYCIGFLKNSDGVFIDHKQMDPIAPTFEESLDLINSNSSRLY